MFARLVLVVSVSVLFLSACATSTPYKASWQMSGKTADDAVTDLSKCRYEVGINKIDAQQQAALVKDCMQAKGYRWR